MSSARRSVAEREGSLHDRIDPSRPAPTPSHDAWSEELHDVRQRLARTEARLASRRRNHFLGAAALASTLSAGLWAGRALSQASCGAVNALPGGYTTMCPNTPAVADNVNANFKKLIERVEAGSATTDAFGSSVVTFPKAF